MSVPNQDVKLKPVYDEEGLLTGWKVLYWANPPGLLSPFPRWRFFSEVIVGEGYLEACKFRTSLKRAYEDTK